MRFDENSWKRTPKASLSLLWAFVVVCAPQAFAQVVQNADWFGGSGAWSNPEHWGCSTAIADKDGDCVPNGFNVAVGISNGSAVTLDITAATNVLSLVNGSSLTVGSGVTLTNELEDLIGESGSLKITGGGVVSDGTVGLGFFGSGTATVTGKGSEWKAGNIAVGGSGQGTLTIANGGVVSGSSGGLGDAPGSSGTVTVTGSGSQWNATELLNIGVQGQGTLTINSGGAVNVTGVGVSVGSESKSVGTVTVTGAGSQLNASSVKVYVGGAGHGALTLQQGATGSSLDLDVGSVAGSTGTVMLTDAGTKWTNSVGTVTIGDAGTGTLTVQNGAELSTQDEFVGKSHLGTLNLSGGSNSVSEDLTLGPSGTYNLSGTGDLTVAGKGSEGLFPETVRGHFFETGGTNTVTGTGLQVGGSSGFYVQSGGETSVPTLELSGASGGGQYVLKGSGTLTVAAKEEIGFGNNGTFTQSGGTNTGQELAVGALSVGHGTYNLSGNGLLKTGAEIIGFTLQGHIAMGSLGVFTQTGGTNEAGSLVVGAGVAGSSSYNLSGNGVLNVTSSESILAFTPKGGGAGAFNQTRGTNSASTVTIDGKICVVICTPDGTYNLSGGTLKVTNLTDNGLLDISGTGALTAGSILVGSTGTATLTGTSISVNATSTTNDGKIIEKGFGTGSTIHWGKFTGNPPIITSTVTNAFTDLSVISQGYIQSVPGSRFDITGNFINDSTKGRLWNTSTSVLDFTGSGGHTLDLGGKAGAGFTGNFAWGTLVIDAGNTLKLVTGSGDALYANTWEGLNISGDAITNIDGAPGISLYYNPANNPQLQGDYTLKGGGELMPSSPSQPTPEPATLPLFSVGLLSLKVLMRRTHALSRYRE